MPNLNFTSSSFAQQDRYAQTTVSYESRNMQSIPFYPGVDHKAKLRGIMAMAIVIAICAGAVLGLMYGLRDYLVDFAKQTPIYSAVVEETEEQTPPPIDEEMNVSLAAETATYSNSVSVNDSYDAYSYKTVTYNGKQQQIPFGISNDIADYDPTVTITFAWMKIKDSNGKTTTDSYHSAETGWPVNAGTYLIEAKIKSYLEDGVNGSVVDTRKVELVIAKASVKAPTLTLPTGEDLVYNNTEKVKKSTLESEIRSQLPSEFRGSFEIAFYRNNSSINSVKNVGEYKITVTINNSNSDTNYNKSTYTYTLAIQKAKVLASYLKDGFTDTSAVYDGKAKSITIDADKLSAQVPSDLKQEIRNGKVSYGYTVNNPTKVGTYVVTATIKSDNYTIVGNLQATLEITKANLSDFFTFKDVTTVYNGKSVPLDLLNIVKIGFPDEIKEGISLKYVYYSVDSKGKATEIAAANIMNAGNYKVELRFGETENYKVPTTPLTINVKIQKADIDVTKIAVEPVSGVYNGGKLSIKPEHITGLPAGVTADLTNAFATNAGNHSVVIKLKGDNYNNAQVMGEIKIAKSQFGYVDVTAKVKQSVVKDGTPHLPEWTGTLPEGAWVDYYVGGKQIDGIDRLGTYDVKIVVTSENQYYEIPVKFSVTFNFLTILLGIAVCLVIAFIIAPIVWLGYRRIEAQSFKKFARLRARILHERGGARGAIVCEGRVTIINWNSEQEHRDFPWIVEPRWGRLYLTHATLEYYDSDYKKNYRNHLVQLKDVTGVEIRGVFLRNKLIVFAKGGRFVYYVEPNTAYLWRRDILHFRNLQHLYPMENNVVDNDYPFNYTVITDGD